MANTPLCYLLTVLFYLYCFIIENVLCIDLFFSLLSCFLQPPEEDTEGEVNEDPELQVKGKAITPSKQVKEKSNIFMYFFVLFDL